MNRKLSGSAWKCFGRGIIDRMRKTRHVWQCLQCLCPKLCLLCVKIFLSLNGRNLGFFCFRRSMIIMWSR